MVLQSVGDAPRWRNWDLPSSPTAQGFSKNWVALAVVPPQLRQEQQRPYSSEQVLGVQSVAWSCGWLSCAVSALSTLQCVPDSVEAFVAQAVSGQPGCRIRGHFLLAGFLCPGRTPCGGAAPCVGIALLRPSKSTDVTVTAAVGGRDFGIARHCQEVGLAQAGTVPCLAVSCQLQDSLRCGCPEGWLA